MASTTVNVLALILLLAMLGMAEIVPAQEKTRFAQVGLPEKLVPADAQVGVAATVCFLEGPAFDGEGNLFFSDIAGNRILKMDPSGRVSVFRENSGRTNGNTFDAQGRLLSCEGAEMGSAEGRRRIVRTDLKTGQIEVLTDRYEGKRYNSPNDICVDIHGRIWFTDPYYGPDRHILEMGHEAVYRIDPDGKVTRVLTQPAIQRPNGIAITPDAKTLYVVDSHPQPGGNRKIWAFSVKPDGSLTDQRLVFDFGRGRGGDGMRLDVEGNLWVCAGVLRPRGPGETDEVPPGVYVISPQGKLLGRIPIPEDLITNLAFGGPERKTLYVTAGKTIYRIPVNVSGYALYPPLR
jgi:gluconolactonase